MTESEVAKELSELKRTEAWTALIEIKAALESSRISGLFNSPKGSKEPLVQHECYAQIMAARHGELAGISALFIAIDSICENSKPKRGSTKKGGK